MIHKIKFYQKEFQDEKKYKNCFVISCIYDAIYRLWGGSGDPVSENPSGGDNPKTSIKVEKNAKAQLGVLSQAMVKIFELGTSPRKLIATEITTSGDTIDDIGNFNAHEKELKDDKFYLYEVHGGKDMDADDDGVIDSTPTVNDGIFRAVVKGSDIKSLSGKFKVTAVSEILYKKVEDHIDNVAVLREKLKDVSKLIIKDDLNSDGKVDTKDILLYNPIKHEEKLQRVYKEKLAKITDDIHKKRDIDIAIAPKIEGNTFIIAENATSGNKVGQVEIIDDGQAPITDFRLEGEGSSKFTIDEKGVIRVNALSVLSLKTLKTYNLKAIATNRVGESNEAEVKINVMEIDKYAPVFNSKDTFTVAENAPYSQTIDVSDDSSVSFSLEGDDSEFFAFDPKTKKLSFNQTLDYETPKDENGDNVYNVIIKATDTAGNSSSQNINVTVTDVADVKPVLGDGAFEITSTDLGAPIGTVVPKSEGDSAISSYKLSGEGSELFAISKSGEITVKSDKLETSPATSYALKVTATNEAGESNSALISISYKDTTAPIFAENKSATVAENEPFSLQLDATDRTAITYTIDGGNDKDKFDITANGVLSFNGTANYEEPSDSNKDNKYEVRVKATDSAGNSSYQNITVSVTDVADVKPVLKNTTFEIPENFTVGSLGKVKVENQGDSAITNFSLTGTGSENFSIDSIGNISLNEGVTLTKNTTYNLTAKATNDAGDSNGVTVTIKVIEVQYISFLTPLEVEVPEGTKKAVQLGAESQIGADPITFSLDYSYYGDYNDNDKFTIDQYNNLVFKDTTDYENPSDTYHSSYDGEKSKDNVYRVPLTLKDAKNNEIKKVLHIKVTNVPDVKPVITNTKLAISGTVLPNTVVGSVKIDRGDSEITQMTLSGADAELFTIDRDGVIKTAKTIPADKKSIYLKVKATSPAGVSDEKAVTVNVKDEDPNVRGVAQLGLERNATVKIFKINNDGTYTKLWTETTSDGDIGSAGRFNTHSQELEDKSYYLYQVTGGEDIDANNDGIEDENATQTKGAMRAIVRGEWLKAMDDDAFKITALSEMHYIHSFDDIKNNYLGLKGALATHAKELLKDDINGDGNIDGKDILLFDPVVDKDRLKEDFRGKFDGVVEDLHKGYDGYAVKPKLLGSIDTYSAYRVTISADGTKAYVADGSGGLKIIDVSDATNPTLLGSIDTYRAREVILSADGTKAYIADGEEGLKIMDVSDSSNLSLIGSLNTRLATAIKLSKDGTKAYVSDSFEGLNIVDISDPTNPTRLGNIYTSNAIDIALSSDGTKAYVVDYIARGEGGPRIVDISNATNPTQIGLIKMNDAYSIILSADSTKAYVANDGYKMNDAGLKIINVSDPENPTLLGSINTSSAYGITLSKDGTKAYVADGSGGLKIIDVSDTTNPTLLGSINTSYANGVILSADGTKAYVADGREGLKIIDVSTEVVKAIE